MHSGKDEKPRSLLRSSQDCDILAVDRKVSVDSLNKAMPLAPRVKEYYYGVLGRCILKLIALEGADSALARELRGFQKLLRVGDGRKNCV